YVIYKLARYMAPHLPVAFQGLANWLSAAALIAWVVMPFLGFMKELQLTREDMKPGGRLRRLALIGGIFIAAFAALCFVPRQLVIKRAVAVELAEPEAVHPEVEGRVKEIYVHEGERLAAGDKLARLENREIDQEL